MKKFKLQSILFVLFLATVLTSCSNDDDTPDVPQPVTKNSLVTKIEGPVTGKVDEIINLDVTFNVNNGCGSFDKIVDTTIGTEKGLEVQAKYEGESCSQIIVPVTTIYKFKSTAKGSFVIKFKKSETEFLSHTVVID